MMLFTVRKLFYTLSLSLGLSIGTIIGQMPLKAEPGLPQGVDAVWIFRDVHQLGPVYTDLLRRFIPGQALEESLLNYLLDLGYPDFEELCSQSPIGFFLAKKEPSSASSLAFIALKLKQASQLGYRLAQQGWTVYEHQGWSFISLASADHFSHSLGQDAWVNYLNAPQEQDFSCVLSCQGLEKEIQALYHFVLKHLVPESLKNTTTPYEKRPLALALKEEIASLETLSFGFSYVALEDRLDITSTFKALEGTALAEFCANSRREESSCLELGDLPRAFLKAHLAINPPALTAYLGYLQSKAIALETASLVSSTGQASGAKGSSWAGLGLQSLASFEKSWNGQSLLYCFYPEDKSFGHRFFDFTCFQAGNFTQGELFTIAQAMASYLPAFWQSLSPGQDQIIHASLTPAALRVEDCFLNALEFHSKGKGADNPPHRFILYSGAKESYGIFTSHLGGLEATLERLEPSSALHSPEAMQPYFLKADLNLLAFYQAGPSLEDLRFVPKMFVAKAEANLEAESLKIAIHLPLRALELIFFAPSKPLGLDSASAELAHPSETPLTKAIEASD